MDLLSKLKRTHYCGEINITDAGKNATVFGWVQRRRALGGLVFIDLRDRTGIVQAALDGKTPSELFEKAESVKSEYVLAVTGIVRERSSKNMQIATGEVEIEVSELLILNKSETPPFEITDNCNTAETARLKHRYLDLRRPVLQKNILLRNKINKITRDYFYDNGFIEIETPILIKSTPEGARDFLVPSRI
ncbi:MAG: OB-fold nucleic acid binding domain-containing protein, partial [Oscillospiraceae bacterium]|nr:OB-fold nucleic acid binding domain-containing protein [Oscillospiraceae bacterium]